MIPQRILRFAISSISLAAIGFSQPTFEMTWLGAFSGVAVAGRVSTPTGINSLGEVVGWSYNTNGVPQGFVFSNGTTNYVGNSDSQSSHTYRSINDSGLLAGQSSTTAILRSGSTLTTLGTLGGSNGSAAYAINNPGQVTGYAWIAGNVEQHAFIYSNGTMTDLGSLNASYGSWGWDINDSGHVVGEAHVTASRPHAFLHAGVTMVDLTPGYAGESGAYALNSHGEVVGYAYTINGIIPVRFENGTFSSLGSLGGITGAAFDINDSGDVVGWSRTTQGSTHAFSYIGGTMFDLNDVTALSEGWALTKAVAINNNGEIAAIASYGGFEYAVVLTPIPEPSTLALLLGCAALGIKVIRRRI